ncbi:MAG TPA: AAA family ATPase [Candidatus Acidoferrales bacterium]|nr:AAA family ATPase [Candidatus Acidoferrales bacterium]
MFLDFYHLREQPFGMTPDPAYLYASQTHSETLSSLSLGIKENRGFFALIAEPGMGKTTLLYQLLDDLRGNSRTVLVSQTQCDSREFVEYILHDLGVNAQGMSFVAMHGKLNEVLFEELLAGKRFVLAVDEAQNLDDSVLETLRMLSNFETHNTKLLQIILAGQPRLAGLLALPRLSQLRQRIAVLGHLRPFGAEETGQYINHRLKVAGYSGDLLFEPLFSPSAVSLIAQHSQGIPRNINNICYNSMLLASSRGFHLVTSQIVQEAVNRLDVRLLALEQAAYVDPGSNSTQPAPPTKDSGHKSTLPAAPASLMQQTKSESLLTYNQGKQPGRSKWSLRIAGGAGIVLCAISVLAILNYSAPKLDNAPAASQTSFRADAKQNTPDDPTSARENYDAAPQDTEAGQVLTVIAGPGQTMKDLSLRYAGRFDDDLSNEILRLNPDLKDLEHLEAGQLIRIPLPPGAMKKVNDIGDDGVPTKAAPAEGLFGRFAALFRERK